MTARGVALVAILLASLLMPLPAGAAVVEGDPLVWYMGDSQSSSNLCGTYTLVAAVENITGYGTCGSGFAIGAGGTSIAPPHVFQGFGLNRTVEVGTAGQAHLVFSEIFNPGVYEVQITVSAGGVRLLGGRELCNLAAPCDIALAGDGGLGRFEDVIVQVDFPTIAGVFTPSIFFGGSDPSRIEAEGAWGIGYPAATAAADVITPLANLTTDRVLYLGLGAGQRCFGMSLTRLAESYCLVGNEHVTGNRALGEHWVAPRGLNISGDAVLRLGLAPYLTEEDPTPGTMALDVTLVAMGRAVLHGRADCSWDALPRTCDIPLQGRDFSIPWKGVAFLDITATTDSPAVRLAAGPDPGSLTFSKWTWDPDPSPEAPALAAPGIGLPFLAGTFLLLAARRRH